MGSPTDIQKLMGQMQRAQSLTDQAANSGRDSEVILNNFAQTLSRFNDHIGKVKEYDNQLTAMMAVTDNGGPPLDSTFPPSTDVVHTVPVIAAVTEPSSVDYDVRGVGVSEIGRTP